MSAKVQTVTTDGCARVTLTSPVNRNALSRQLLEELRDALRDTAEAPEVRVVVLTGAGSVFCAGADLKEQQDGRGPGPVGLHDVMEAILRHPRPVVARVAGPARAGGVGLLAACDLAVGLEDATFAFSEVRIGVVPALISVPVVNRIGTRAARHLFLTGSTFDGRDAERLGLLDRAVAADLLDTAVDELVDQLSAGGPEALRATKELLGYAGDDWTDRMARLRRLSERHFASDEGQEGISALRERRRPRWLRERAVAR